MYDSTTTTCLYFTQKVHKVQLEDLKINAWIKTEKKKNEQLIRLTREVYSGGGRETDSSVYIRKSRYLCTLNQYSVVKEYS